ncbi:hypothetical protein LMG30237_ALEAABJJ_01600 [Fructobacillus tropaeoli]|nr:hypothetical protein LMG30237_ALEAABJJ_01600 [Fructobacillus tropaeoli]
MIIDNLFIDSKLGMNGGESFLQNFDILFEQFIRKILSQTPNREYKTWKQSSIFGTVYEKNQKVDERVYIPDIIFKEKQKDSENEFRDSALAVIDVKNKAFSQFKPADIYQILTYSALLKSKIAILVYPSFLDKQPLKFDSDKDCRKGI